MGLASLLPSETLRVDESWYTPAGKRRRFPQYEVHVANSVVGTSHVFRGSQLSEVVHRAHERLEKWRGQQDHIEGADSAEDLTARCAEQIDSMRSLLQHTLSVDDRIDWSAMRDERPFPPFQYTMRAPTVPAEITRVKADLESFWCRLFRSRRERLQARLGQLTDDHARKVALHEAETEAARLQHERRRDNHLAQQERHNAALASFQRRFEAGEADAVVEYLEAVFERSAYPDTFPVEHRVEYVAADKTVIVDLEAPPPTVVPTAGAYRYVKSRGAVEEVPLKEKERQLLYGDALKQALLRTLHEVFESDYARTVDTAIVSAWVSYTDAATGIDARTCVCSVVVPRTQFASFDLERLDPTACLTRLEWRARADLARLRPVEPFVPAAPSEPAAASMTREAAADKEMPWRTFEGLVQGLVRTVFASPGSEVAITRSSQDEGIDAVVRDPDPVRGGTFVVQARRDARVAGAEMIRELHGAMQRSSATRGLLLSTASFGRDAREFARGKPITLVDGSSLVQLLAEHGHRLSNVAN